MKNRLKAIRNPALRMKELENRWLDCPQCEGDGRFDRSVPYTKDPGCGVCMGSGSVKYRKCPECGLDGCPGAYERTCGFEAELTSFLTKRFDL